MARYIDADKLKTMIRDRSYGSIEEAIDNVPEEDVRPAKRAKWQGDRPGIWCTSRCTACGAPMPHETEDEDMGYMYERNNHYCYNCGAEMENWDGSDWGTDFRGLDDG